MKKFIKLSLVALPCVFSIIMNDDYGTTAKMKKEGAAFRSKLLNWCDPKWGNTKATYSYGSQCRGTYTTKTAYFVKGKEVSKDTFIYAKEQKWAHKKEEIK